MGSATSNLLDRFEHNTHLTLQEQVRRHVRQAIVSGGIEPGRRLPPIHELASRWSMNVRTVRLALASLVSEGVLTSVPRVGTFVAKREEKLTRVALVYSQEVFELGESEFLRSLHKQLTKLLESQGIEVAIMADGRPQAEQDKPWDALRLAAAHAQIQAMIVPALTRERMAWMEKLPIPAAYLSTAIRPNTVQADVMQLIDMGLECLVAQGCRSVGLICPVFFDNKNNNKDALGMKMVRRFIDRSSDLGLTVKNEWVRLSKTKSLATLSRAFGYRECRHILAQIKRPEGLLVCDDIVMRGVITAILEARVDVPREMKIVSSKNKHVELFCPFPISQIELDEKEIAKALIEQIQAQFRGDLCRVNTKVVGYTLKAMR